MAFREVVVQSSKLAWEIYRLGWDNDFECSKEYSDFGQEVLNLAENLDILDRVIENAGQQLQRTGINKPPRWDPASLREILGDYEQTLNNCFVLLQKNDRYRFHFGPEEVLEWNILLEPETNRQREQIALHSFKIVHVLKPFEVDLLRGVREDIRLAKNTLRRTRSRVTFHMEEDHLIGVLVPDVNMALSRRIEIPIDIEIPQQFDACFEESWQARSSDAPDSTLRQMADAFIICFNSSTLNVKASPKPPTVATREQYMSILKCVWLIQSILELKPWPAGTSHWPSYIQELKEELAVQCARFGSDLTIPNLAHVGSTPEVFSFCPRSTWSDKGLLDSLNRSTKNNAMHPDSEEVMTVQLRGTSANTRNRLRLFRHSGVERNKFRAEISDVQQDGTKDGVSRLAEVIDFNVKFVALHPLYITPLSPGGGVWDMVLRNDSRTACLSFTKLSEATRFQHAVTGFHVYEDYTEGNTSVKFIFADKTEPVVADAWLQLWYPREVSRQPAGISDMEPSGELVSKLMPSTAPAASFISSSKGDIKHPSQEHTEYEQGSELIPSIAPTASSVSSSMPWSWDDIKRSSGERREALNIGLLRKSREYQEANTNFAGRDQSSTASAASYVSMIQDDIKRFAERRVAMPTILSRKRRGYQEANTNFAGRDQYLGPFQPQRPSSPSSISTASASLSDTFTVFSKASAATSSSAYSPSSIQWPRPRLPTLFSNREGSYDRSEVKPMLVLFVRDSSTGQTALVTVDIDREININPDRCDCGQPETDGMPCTVASIETHWTSLERNLPVRKFQGWDVARLAAERCRENEDATAWKNVKRISITFPTAERRARFGGTPGSCRCDKTTGTLLGCLEAGHAGYFGRIRESWRLPLCNKEKAKPPTDLSELIMEEGFGDHSLEIDETIFVIYPKMREIAREVTRALSYQDTSSFRVTLETDWKPLEFLNTYIDESKPLVDIGSVVTFTGLISSAFATTCSEYFSLTWPQSDSSLLSNLEAFIRETQLGTQDSVLSSVSSPSTSPSGVSGPSPLPSGISTVPPSSTIPATFLSTNPRIQLSLSKDANLIVKADGTASTLVEVAQQVAWLTSALRTAHDNSGPRPAHHYADVKVMSKRFFKANEYPATTLTVSSRLEKVPPSEESCWLGLVSRDTVIARGFPVPERDAAKGLEIPLPILVEMAGVHHVVEFRGGVVMKGLSSMLLPISRKDDITQWHLVSAPSNAERLTYHAGIDLCKSRALSDEVPLGSVTKSRAVVGWCRRAVSRLGSEDMAYDNIDYSDAKESPAVINVSSLALGIQQIGMGQIEFTVGARYPRSHFKREGTYAHLLNVATRMKVLMYDTRERWAWLVGADEVILHIIRKRHSMDRFLNSDGQEVWIEAAETAKKTLLSNRTLVLMEDDERPETLRDMVSRLFSLFEFLIDENVKRDASPEMTVSTHAGHELAGYEFMAVAEEQSPYHRKHSPILKTSGGWTALVEACDALVLFASGFEDLIRPAEQAERERDAPRLCHKYGTVPRDNDYLATRVAVLTELYVVAGCKLTRECLSSSGLCWHREALLFEDCTSPDSFRCSCNRLQRIVSRSSLGAIEKPGILDDDGAVIFGRSSERPTLVLPSRKGKEKATTLYQQPNVGLASTSIAQSLETLVEESSCSETDSEDIINVYDTAASSVSSAEKPKTQRIDVNRGHA